MSIPSTRTIALTFAVTAAALLTAYLGSIPWWGALVSIGVLVWFSAPGVVFTRRLIRSDQSAAHWLFGPVWGIAISTLGLLALWELGFHAFWILIAAPWPLWILLCLPLSRAGADVRLPAFDRRDALAVALVLLLAPAIAGVPYSHVGATTANGGKAYRAYFTADFVWAMTVVSEVSKGDLPPKNPFQTGGTLHYYWLSHFLSAAEYRILGPLGLSVEQITLANSLAYSAAFVAFFYGFVRAFGATAGPTVAACLLVFFASSFEALDRIVAWWSEPALMPLLTDINVDAITRWFYLAMPVDGLHRMILYQPHHLGGYAIGLSALLITARAERPGRPAVALVAGSLLGVCLLLSSFTAIIIGVTVGLVYAVRLLSPPQWLAIPVCAILGAAPIALAFEATEFLAYVDPAASTVINFGPNALAMVHWAYVLLLSFGPMLLLGAAGVAVAVVTPRRESWPIILLAITALGFYFLTDVPDMQHVWVGWRAGHLLFVASAVLTACLFTWAGTAPEGLRISLTVVTVVLALAALPTTVLDLYNAQDISNLAEGPGFPWTLALTRMEVDALTWLKTHTPAGVIVQADMRARDSRSWGYITAFGERRMATGLPIAMIPMDPYRKATEVVGDKIFSHGTPAERAAKARRFGIDYLYVGPDEQRAHPDLVAVLDSRSDLFPVVFRNDEVVIYWVAP